VDVTGQRGNLGRRALQHVVADTKKGAIFIDESNCSLYKNARNRAIYNTAKVLSM